MFKKKWYDLTIQEIIEHIEKLQIPIESVFKKKWFDLTILEIIELIDFMEKLQIPIEGEDEELSEKRKIHWISLRVTSLCFFMDCKLPNDWNKYYREFYTLQREIYLSLYGVLKSSWRKISLEARHKNFDIPKKSDRGTYVYYCC